MAKCLRTCPRYAKKRDGGFSHGQGSLERVIRVSVHKAVFILLLSGIASAAPYRQIVEFSHTEDVGFGSEVCVVGDHPALGGGDVLLATKLSWSTGNVWTAKIALPAGEEMTYRYIKRSNAIAEWCDAAHPTDLTAEQTLQVPPAPSTPWAKKTICYYTGWERTQILYNDRDDGDQDNWEVVEMDNIGTGRHAAEFQQKVYLPVPLGHEVEFVFKNATAEEYDNAFDPPNNGGSGMGSAPDIPYPYQGLSGPYNYRTDLDVFLIQGGQVYSYRPSASVSGSRQETFTVNSTVAEIPSRTARVYLPRGYDEHVNKSYPLLIMHDGQNCFFPGGAFGTWDADRIADYETSQGRMQEIIIVGIDNVSNRTLEYAPPNGGGEYGGNPIIGIADKYGQFLKEDAIPAILSRYRVLEKQGGGIDPDNSCIAGSSMGGIVSDYLCQEYFIEGGDSQFGAAGIFSPAYWSAPDYETRRAAFPKYEQKLYLYMGTSESSAGNASSQLYWDGALRAYDAFASKGYSINDEMLFEWGCGAMHNEPTWSRHMPSFYHFTFPVTRSPNWLALELFPPALQIDGFISATNKLHLSFPALSGISYQLQSSPDLINWTDNPQFPLQYKQPWQEITLEETTSPSPRHFYRIVVP